VPWRADHAWHARGHAQIALCRPQGIKALIFAVDQHGCRRIGAYDQPPAEFGKRGLARQRLGLSEALGISGGVEGADRKAGIASTRAADAAEKPVRLGDDFETRLHGADGFRAAEQQNPALAQREVKQGNDLRLRFRAQIDQQVAARNQIEA
jgi:hypothetical protein